MKKVNVTLWMAVLLWAIPLAQAQQALSLEECRRLAAESNNRLKIAEEKVEETDALKGAAIANFFPKISVNGTYNWNQKSIALLSDEQQHSINTMGTTMMASYNTSVEDFAGRLSQVDPRIGQALLDAYGSVSPEEMLNDMGHQITDAFNIDMTHVFAGAVTVSEPVYMGGKIRAMYQLSKLSNEAAKLQVDKQKEELMIQVDEAYWRVVSLQHKQELARQYCALLDTLSHDVEVMLEEGVATPSDVTKVRVKLNEARMSLTKAENGLALSKMALYQLCGLDLRVDYRVTEDNTARMFQPEVSLDMQQVWDNRTEIKLLELGDRLARTNVRIATSGLLPNVAVSSSYLVSNPNILNGYQNKFGGMFTAGVVVNIPICHVNDIYAVKAAKHRRNQVQYELEEAKGMIELQVNKLNYELEVANRKLAQAQSNLENAEENLRLADESFEAGVISSSDLMAAQTAWLSAKSEVVDAEIEARMDYLYLQQALGR